MCNGNGPVRVAFVSLYAYPLFDASHPGIFGGSEVRAWLFSRAIAERPSREVSVIAMNHGQRSPRRFGAVSVHAHSFYRDTAAFNGAQRLWRRLLGSAEKERTQIYRDVSADVMIVFGVTELTAEVADYCGRSDAACIVMLGSDIDLDPSRERHLSVLDQASCVVAQTDGQLERLAERPGIQARLIRNPVPTDVVAAATDLPRRHVLWVGKSDDIKRPDELITLARRLPHLQFLMVMNRSDGRMHDEIVRGAPPNVRIEDRVSLQNAEKLFAQSIALVNTSRFEGFPNTFLQAGAAATPVLSLQVDPDGFIQRSDCGACARGEMDRLASALDEVASNEPRRRQLGANGRRYVKEFHALEDRARDLDAVIQDVLKRRASAA